ncbi:AEC family transporter [Ramlibacter sp. 2FC]|uniref:AEC family transporter n=1 Tax=Ramlibacter sp. 2FC TaxID=2502188 RepID=UPI0010F87DAC|nr:AEC family transporter [Ramlibacter sp. 2FC]
MAQILGVTFPFFALVLCGFVAARRRLVGFEAIPGLNVFVLYLALPCMLYRFAARTPLAQLLDAGVVLTYLLAGLAMLALALAAARRRGLGWNDAAFGALVAAFPNSGFMGVPLLVALLGPLASAPAIVTLALDMVLTSSVCIALSRLDAGGAQGPGRAAALALRGMAANPLPWAILLGVASSATGLQAPPPLERVVGLLADCASPAALFTLGCVLARTRHQAAQAKVAGTRLRGDVLEVALLKLLVHPLVVLALGLALDPFSALVLVLVAALPSASNVPMLAERFGAQDGRIAQVVLLTTAAAFLTFSVAVALRVPAGGLARLG